MIVAIKERAQNAPLAGMVLNCTAEDLGLGFVPLPTSCVGLGNVEATEERTKVSRHDQTTVLK